MEPLILKNNKLFVVGVAIPNGWGVIVELHEFDLIQGTQIQNLNLDNVHYGISGDQNYLIYLNDIDDPQNEFVANGASYQTDVHLIVLI